MILRLAEKITSVEVVWGCANAAQEICFYVRNVTADINRNFVESCIMFLMIDRNS